MKAAGRTAALYLETEAEAKVIEEQYRGSTELSVCIDPCEEN